MTVTADRPLAHVAGDAPTDAPLPYPTEARHTHAYFPSCQLDPPDSALTCPVHGAPMQLVNVGSQTRTETSAVLRCPECPSHDCEWQLMVRLIRVREDPRSHASPTVAAHGTPAGYRRHGRLGEPPCAACRQAHAEEVRNVERRNRSTGVFV